MAVAARAEPYRSGVIIARKYRLAERLGVGAMGTVWSAVNLDTHGRVAVKLIERPEAELRHRLLREARVCASIQHKNVVQVFDVGQTASEDPFLLMELLCGETLAAFLARKRSLAAGEACAIARDIARGLAAAHAQGIVHRDLKPANVFLHDQPGEDAPVIKLLDFGVSKSLTSSDGLRTVVGVPIGSPVYMSPEQACGRPDVDFRTDIWSLGVVLYEMLTGERPFSGDPGEVCYKITHDPIPRVSHRVRRVDRDLDELVAGCLTRDRDQRLSSAVEIACRLDARLAAGIPEARGSVVPAADLGPAAPGGAGAPAAAVRPEEASPVQASMVSGTRPRGSAAAWADDADGEDAATVRIETGPALLELIAGTPATPVQESGPPAGAPATPAQESGLFGGVPATPVQESGLFGGVPATAAWEGAPLGGTLAMPVQESGLFGGVPATPVQERGQSGGVPATAAWEGAPAVVDGGGPASPGAALPPAGLWQEVVYSDGMSPGGMWPEGWPGGAAPTEALAPEAMRPEGHPGAGAVRPGGDLPAAPSPSDRSAHAAVTAPSAMERAGRSRGVIYLVVALALVWAAVVCAVVLAVRMRLSHGVGKEPDPPLPPSESASPPPSAPPPERVSPPPGAPAREGSPERAQPHAGETPRGDANPGTNPPVGTSQGGSTAVEKPPSGGVSPGKAPSGGASPGKAPSGGASPGKAPSGGPSPSKSQGGSTAVGKSQAGGTAAARPQGGGAPQGKPHVRTTPGQGPSPACKSKFGFGCKH